MKVKVNRRQISAIIFNISVILSLIVPLSVQAQIRPVYDQGALGVAQLLKRLNTTASALMIGAHPDDEDTALLAYLARGENARTAYLSLTRGDGGQNIIGPELGEALGVIRTEELLQARKLDGAEQFFTRAYDFGFSKTLDEAKQKWDEKVILCDVVRVIRSYQPLVVISQFTGTPVDGHGHHQYAGYISPLAVKAAGDPAQCKEAGLVWEVKKFYVRHRGTGEPTLRINTGKYDPLLGRSYFEIAMHARSQHQSQEQGVLELKGDQFSSLKLIHSETSRTGAETGIFDGLDVSFSGIASGLKPEWPPIERETRRAGEFLALSLHEFDVAQPTKIVTYLLSAVKEIDEALLKVTFGPSSATGDVTEATAEPSRRPRLSQYAAPAAELERKERDIETAILSALGVRVDVLSDRETVAPGETYRTTVKVFYPHGSKVELRSVAGCGTEVVTPETPLPQDPRREVASVSRSFAKTVAATQRLTEPFWLTEPRSGSTYTSVKPVDWSRAFQTLSQTCNIELDLDGQSVTLKRSVQFRFADDIRGEIRRELNIVPKLAVAFDQDLLVVSKSASLTSREMTVTVTNNSAGAINGRVALKGPDGWNIVPASREFHMTRKGENASTKFVVNVLSDVPAGSYELKAEATADDSETFKQTMQTIAYEHIQTHRIYRPAAANVKIIDLQTAPVRVGYIMGSGDRVAEAIKQLGLRLEEIDSNILATGDLSKYDTIVVGIRAYQVRADVVSYNQRLLDFAKNGGTLIVQYQLPQTYSQQNLTPFPTQMGPRVVDENAAVTIVHPAHPILNFPNKITADDFKGWVQERNLYNFSAMDPKYVGLLESHDAGEPVNNGGLVVAEIGKGKYIYCSYSLFRQLPAGVPGAYRLLANMVSLPKAPK